jgi:subtilisin-like proprotein convertase family protein
MKIFNKIMLMKLPFKSLVFVFILSILGLNVVAQNVFFSDSPEPSFRNPAQKRVIIPTKYRTVKLNTAGFLSFVKLLPAEQKITIRNLAPIIELPMPDGTSARFHVWESSTMAPELAIANPGIKTFTGQGIDDPTATIKLDWSEFGFHAMILSATTGTIYIDPYDQQTTGNYISYYKKDHVKKGSFSEIGPFLRGGQSLSRPATNGVLAGGTCMGTQLRTYRLAIACTHEYAIAATGLPTPTVAQALAKIVTTTNRVNGVYEREVDIRMVLIASENSVIFVDSGTDPFTGNNNGGTLLGESQTVIDNNIGSANYDIGHTFSTGGGGVAYLGVVCINGSKAGGITGSTNPVGDGYDIDYVAHEMGHQFGGNHTFNSTAGNCSGNGSPTTNAEPGSGSTIMAYAGICSGDDLQPNSDAQFQALSFNEITDYILNGGGNSCPVITATGNNPPVVNAGLDYIIPKSTPFSLTGSATDPNSDVLTYSWEQVNVGGPFGAWNTPSGNAPLFRSFVPKSTPVRFFPKVSNVINGTDTIGELLPTYARTMNFRLTARDNRAGGGGVCFDESAVTVNAAAGPFLVTYPNAIGITWYVNDFKTITWDPSGTTVSPISCSNVKIELSTDGGNTYPVTILASTPNDGAEEIQVPNNITSSARIRVTAVGNIFYDISNANFSIQNSPAGDFVFNTPTTTAICGAGSSAITLKTGALGGFATGINLSASGNPAGTTVTFGSSPLAPGSNTLVTLNNTSSLAGGTYNITVSGTAGAITKTRIIPFIISTTPTAPTALTAPAYNAIGVSTLASFNWSPVPGAGSYKLEISTSNTFTTIVQTINAISVLPFALTTPLIENTIYYWRVTTTNPCGVSAPSYTGIFKTGLNPCKNSTDVPKTISATGTPIVLSTIVIPASQGTVINDLNVVSLVGTHSFVSDITVTLTSPAGTSVILFDQVCDGFQNFNINLDDEAASAITCPPTGNQTAKPQNLLSAFDGQNSAGTWTLTIRDNFNADGGTLTGWGLSINNCTYVASPISTTPWTQMCASGGIGLTADIAGTVYQWQVNTGAGFTNLVANANYTGVNTKTLQISNAPTSFTGYQYRCIVDGVNSSIFKLSFTSIWNGSVSNAWETAANWNCNSIPDANTDVIINSGTPIVNSAAICRSITVNPAATITVNTGFKITVAH